MKLWRFRIGRWLMHAGLRVMPRGRARHELWILLNEWGNKVRREVTR